MKDVYIAIRAGSPASNPLLLQKTLQSIYENIGNCDWCVGLSINQNINADCHKVIANYVKISEGRICVYDEGDCDWSIFINNAIKRAWGYKYFIKSHDDIELQTKNTYEKIDAEVSRIEKGGVSVGWVSITDTGWRHGDFSPSVRPGYHIDVRQNNAWGNRQIFQFHTFPKFWWRANFIEHTIYRIRNGLSKLLKLKPVAYPKPVMAIAAYTPDMPIATVLCHAPFNHFVAISMKSLKLIGDCESWGTKNALLVDEDWGIRALLKNMVNIWMPHIEYFHYRGESEGGATRSSDQIRSNEIRVHRLFKEKWGFAHTPTDEDLSRIQSKYANSNVPWSSYKYSYDWDYI